MIIGGMFAYFTDRETGHNELRVGKVKIEAYEPHFPTEDTDNDGVPDDCEQILPYSEINKDPYIRNTGVDDAIVFFKVTAPVKTVTLKYDNGSSSEEMKSDLFWYKQSSDSVDTHQNHFDENWVELVSAEEGAGTITTKRTYVFGYHVKLKPGETTEALFDKVQNKRYSCTDLSATDALNIVVQPYAIQAGSILQGDNVLDTSGELSADVLTYIYNVYVNQNS